MNHEIDARLSRLLRADAPQERDVLFRISLIERRERQLHRQRAWLRIAVTAGLIVLPAVVLALARPLTSTLVLGLGVALTAASVVSFRGLRLALHWWRSS
jgi:hypothetical protein